MQAILNNIKKSQSNLKYINNINKLNLTNKFNYNVLQNQIQLSQACLDELNSKIKKQNYQKFLRLMVDGGEGCGGFVYKFQFDENLEDTDYVFKNGEDKVLLAVDDLTLKFVEGCVVDYETTMMRSAFYVIDNPNSVKDCSCKASFTPKESLFQ